MGLHVQGNAARCHLICRLIRFPLFLLFCDEVLSNRDVLAGYYAKKMGLPIGRLVIATNENDIIARILEKTAGMRRLILLQVSRVGERYAQSAIDVLVSRGCSGTSLLRTWKVLVSRS
jgi:hypothetical protein